MSLLYSAADNPGGQFVRGNKYCRMALTFWLPCVLLHVKFMRPEKFEVVPTIFLKLLGTPHSFLQTEKLSGLTLCVLQPKRYKTKTLPAVT